MRKVFSINRGLILITFFYFLSHFLMLFVQGMWWDDCCVWQTPDVDFYKMYGPEQSNHFIIKFMGSLMGHNAIDWPYRSMLYRLYPFICGLLSVFCIYFIVKKVTGNNYITLYTSIFASVLCIDKTTMLVVTCNYQLCLVLFLFGLLFFVYDYYKPRKLFVYLTAFLWFGALIIWRTPIIIIPYLLFVSSLSKGNFIWRRPSSYIGTFRYCLFHYWSVLFILIIFVVLFKTVLAPSGSYAQYYSLDIKAIIFSPFTALTNCFLVFIRYIGEVLSVLSTPGQIGMISLILLLIVYICVHKIKESQLLFRKNLLLIAFCFSLSALLPHMFLHGSNFAIGIDGWNSRITSMLLLPYSFFVAYFLQYVPFKLRIFLATIFICGSIVTSNLLSISYCKGWARNEAFVSFLKSKPELNGKKLVFINNAQDLSVFQSEPERYYEFESCARLAYGLDSKTSFFNYYLDNYDIKDVDYLLIIDKNKNVNGVTTLLLKKFFSPSEYYNVVNNMIIVRLASVENYEL